MSKPKTQAQLDRATDLRLRKTYNISLADYEYLLEQKGGVCWITGRPPTGNRLHVDHDHSWKKVKIETGKHEDKWSASAKYNGNVYICIDPKKSLAVKDVKRQLLRASVRGLIGYSVNAGLQKFSDNPVWLREAAAYLENHENQNPLSGREIE